MSTRPDADRSNTRVDHQHSLRTASGFVCHAQRYVTSTTVPAIAVSRKGPDGAVMRMEREAGHSSVCLSARLYRGFPLCSRRQSSQLSAGGGSPSPGPPSAPVSGTCSSPTAPDLAPFSFTGNLPLLARGSEANHNTSCEFACISLPFLTCFPLYPSYLLPFSRIHFFPSPLFFPISFIFFSICLSVSSILVSPLCFSILLNAFLVAIAPLRPESPVQQLPTDLEVYSQPGLCMGGRIPARV
jgi:hypothetical protein